VSRLPIRLRLTFAFALVMAAVLAALGYVVYARVGGALMSSVDQTLHAQAREASARAFDEKNLIDPDIGAGATIAQLFNANGRVVRSTPADIAPLLRPAETRRIARGHSVLRSVSLARPAGEWRLLAAPTRNAAGTIVVARSLESREETLDRLFREFLIAGPIALLLASIAGYGLAAAALGPVEAMRRRAAAVTARAPGLLPVPRSRDEISRLAETLNDMLVRLRASFEHERRFVADASHELRTPLTLLQTELEVALRRPRSAAEMEQALRSALEDTARLARLAESLLLIARVEEGALPIRPQPVETDVLLETVVSRFAARTARLGRSIRAETSAAVVDADPERVEQALANLVENAVAYGDGEIVLSARGGSDGVELHVTDRGPGFPEDFLSRAFDRFSRADGAHAHDGSGLGLSIVALVASAHGGAAAATNRVGGGADVWLTLPRHSAVAEWHAVRLPA
jgi:two-component system, OmpR family, sensor kinase